MDFKPPSFSGVKDPAVVEDWISHMEKLFDFYGCSAVERVALETFVLRGEAEH